MYKLCDSTGYTYDVKVYVGKERDRQHMSQHLTATSATIIELARKIEGCGQKLYMDNFLPCLNCLMK